MIISPLDAPLVLVLGIVVALVYRQWLTAHNRDWYVVLGTVAVLLFWLHLGVVTVTGATPWGIAPAVSTESAVLAVFYALAYPLWFRLGASLVFLLVGTRPEEGGLLWIYVIEDTTDDFDPSWES